MREAESIDAFLRDPVGRCVAGTDWLVWCNDPTLAGSALWARPGESSARELVRAWSHGSRPGMASSFDVITDGRDLHGIDPLAFEVVAADLRARMTEYSNRMKRHALLHGGGLTATVMAGLLPILGASHTWRVFENLATAFDWLERPNDIAATIEAHRAAAMARTELLRRLRQGLWEEPGISIEQAAKALALSPRSLQRHLKGMKTDFRREQRQIRASLSRSLLADPAIKIDAVARRLGYASAVQFTIAFRKLTGMTPGEARAHFSRSVIPPI
jgi:AraC-like DNA-binding protein